MNTLILIVLIVAGFWAVIADILGIKEGEHDA